jgi:hypothetical protein
VDGDQAAHKSAASKLIVIYCNSKISLHLSKFCNIFCEGVKAATAKSNGLVGYGLISHNCLINQNGLVNHNGLVDRNNLVNHNGPVGCHNDLVGHNDLVDHISLVGSIGHNCLVGFIGLSIVSLIGLGFVGFTSLGLISLVRLIGHISLVGLGGFSGINDFSLIGLIGLIGCISLIVSLASLSALWLCQRCNRAKTKSHSHVIKYAQGVAMVQSRATKITNAAIHFYCAYYAHLFVRESWLWHVFLPRLDSSFYDDALQNAKQLFYICLPLMTKYCIMGECENVLCGYLYDCDLVFVILKGISIFKFPKKFLEISCRDLTSSSLLQSNFWNRCSFPLHLHGSMPCKQSDILSGGFPPKG